MSLFAVQLLHLFTELRDAGLLPKPGAPGCGAPVQCADPDLQRILLCSPSVVQQACVRLKADMVRVRIGYPPSLDVLELSERAQLEVYDYEGRPLMTPLQLTELDDAWANAIQVELFHALLKKHGSSIPLL